MANKTVATTSDTRLNTIERTVVLQGISEIMFDRYPGDNDTKLEWHQKVYLRPGSSQLVMPSTNIVSFLSSHNTNSAPKRLRDPRKFKKICNACLSFVMVTAPDGSHSIPFLDGDMEPIEMGTPGKETDEQSGLYLHRSVARLEKGIPNPKERAVLPMPWHLKFKLTIFENREIKEQEVRNLFIEAGIAIGLGTYRGVFGKFLVQQWDYIYWPGVAWRGTARTGEERRGGAGHG